jgi:phosphatidylglycerophosphatase A
MSVFLAQLATLGPIGRYLPAPGTAGSISALITGFFLAKNGFIILLSALLLVTILGVFAADAYSQLSGKDDAGEVIIDEVAGQWLVLLCIPPNLESALLWYVAGFVLFRLFDILKPWPVSAAEALPGGLGVMADDVVAGILAGMVLLMAQLLIYPA